MDEKEKLEEINQEFITNGAKKIKDDDLQKVIDKADQIKEKFSGAGPLQRFIDDLQLLISVIKDYWDGKYREIPYFSIAAIVFALLYVLSPVDLIPDFIPGIGYLDDAAVVALCLLMVEQDLHDYAEWKKTNAS